MTYMFSAGYLGQDGIIDIAKYDRYSVRGNMNAKMGKFTAGMNLSFTYGEAQEPVSGFTGEMSNIFHKSTRSPLLFLINIQTDIMDMPMTVTRWLLSRKATCVPPSNTSPEPSEM